jgi:hypothetical protein
MFEITESLKKSFFQLSIKFLLLRNKSLYFPIYSQAPKYLNFAFPDFSVQYFMLAIKPNIEYTLEGVIPFDKLNFFSISLYDTLGDTIFNKNDTQLNTDKSGKYKINIQRKNLCCLIVRFYKKNEYINEDFYSYLPAVSPPHKKISLQERKKKNETIGNELTYIISLKNKSDLAHIKKHSTFFLPAKSKLDSFFANGNATYLVVFPTYTIMKVKFKHYPYDKNRRFVGFMASNFITTATDSSQSFPNKEQDITLWVTFRKHEKKLKQIGYKEKKHFLMFWNNSNKSPVLIYRELNVKETKLSSINNKKTNVYETKLRKIMKDSYPQVEYFNL